MQTKQKSPLKYISYVLIAATIISGFALSHPAPMASADVSDTATARVTVSSACSLSNSDSTYARTIASGSSLDIVANAITVSCNDSGGLAIYAKGDTQNLQASSTPSNDDILGTVANTYGSSWRFSLSGSGVAIISAFMTPHTIPGTTYTAVASTNSAAPNATITPTYSITIGNTQPAGTYTGGVRYTIVHPQNHPAPTI